MRPDETRRGVWSAPVLVAFALGLAAGGPGCSRLNAYEARLGAIPSAEARRILRDTLWAHGSHCRWADHQGLQCEVTWTEFTPLGETASHETWRLDAAAGRLRVDAPEKNETALFDGIGWRFLVGGKPVEDVARRARMAGVARVAQEFTAMPFSLLDAGLEIGYAGTAVGPAEARAWDKLTVAYAARTGRSPSDRMTVEVRQSARRVEAVVIRWDDLPFASRTLRVEMDDWHEHDSLVLSHRYRFYGADDSGGRAGPLLYEVRVTGLALLP